MLHQTGAPQTALGTMQHVSAKTQTVPSAQDPRGWAMTGRNELELKLKASFRGHGRVSSLQTPVVCCIPSCYAIQNGLLEMLQLLLVWGPCEGALPSCLCS